MHRGPPLPSTDGGSQRRPLAVGISLSGIAFVALYAVVAFPRSTIPLIDGDIWWHIRAGQAVLESGAVPSADTWTIVGEGMPWISQDWLTNVGMAAAASAGTWGWTLLSLIFALLVVASLAALAIGINVHSSNVPWVSTLMWLAVGLTVAGPTLGVRSQVVDLPLASATMLVLWKYSRDRQPRVLVALPIIAVLWANLHAGWVLMFLLGGAIIVGEIVDQGARRRVDPPPLDRRQLSMLAVALIVSAGALALNPNGWRLYTYPLEAGIASLAPYLAEWAPPSLGGLPGQLFAGFAVVGVIPALLFGSRYLRSADILILGGLTVMTASAARFLLVAGPIGAAIVAIALGGLGASKLSAPMLGRMARSPRSQLQARLNLVLAGTIIAGGAAIAFARSSPSAQIEAVGQHMPVRAVDWILANDPGDRPFNTYSWGGYLGLRQPGEPVYIDGRADIFGEEPIRAYEAAVLLRSDPQKLFDEHGIDYILFNVATPLADWLDQQPGWDRAYLDDQAGVWVRAAD